MQNNLIHIENLYKSYSGNTILDNIDLSVKKGEFCTILGPSGCGKSTLLRLILGQEKQDNGNILIENNPVGFADTDRGVVYQKYSLFPHLSVLDNVTLSAKLKSRNWKRDRANAEAEALAFLERMRIRESAHKYPHELSGGMQQRVAIAQALIARPKILLMDEPFGALDPSTREDLQLFLIELWEEYRMTVFFITHDIEEALFLGTRLLLLSQYYSDDRESHNQPEHGAKIVMDLSLGKYHAYSDARSSPEFKKLKNEILKKGYDPTYLQHVKDFDLKHPQSFQTLDVREYSYKSSK